MANTTNLTQEINLIVSMLLVFVVPLVGAFLSRFLHAQTGSVRLQQARHLALDLVRAAEQTYDSDPVKRNWVSMRLGTLCPFLNQTQINAILESSVQQVHQALGVSSHDGYSLADAPAVPVASFDPTELINELGSLVAPGLQENLAQIVKNHVNLPVTPEPVAQDTTQSPSATVTPASPVS